MSREIDRQRAVGQIRQRATQLLRELGGIRTRWHRHDELRRRGRSRISAAKDLLVGGLADARIDAARTKRACGSGHTRGLCARGFDARAFGQLQLRDEHAFIDARQNLFGQHAHQPDRDHHQQRRQREDGFHVTQRPEHPLLVPVRERRPPTIEQAVPNQAVPDTVRSNGRSHRRGRRCNAPSTDDHHRHQRQRE